MSRVSYVDDEPGRRRGDDRGRARGAQRAGRRGRAPRPASTARTILEMVFVGNPIMHHLFLGIDPTELGGAPFALATDSALELLGAARSSITRRTRRAGSTSCPASPAMSAPTAAGVVLSETPAPATTSSRCSSMSAPMPRSCSATGTRLLACSSPTGPAFEGAQISCGQRAAPGAIERVRIDRDTLEPRFKVIGCDLWSDEPGFAEATARDRRHRHLRLRHHRGDRRDVPRRHHHQDGVVDGAMAARTPRIEPTGRTFSYLLHEGEPRDRASPRTTCAPSSSPRPRSMPARGC